VEKYLFDKILKRSISKAAKIEKGVKIKGKVFIGENSRVLEGAVLKGPCYIGKNCLIGNNAVVRDYSNLENDFLVGVGGEIARCIFQENVHTHSGFFGDSIFGKDSRVGAGTVTGNVRLDRGEIKSRIGKEKIGTDLKSLGVITGPGVKIGINVSLMPGILIGSNSLIGPASVVFDNIKDNTAFYTETKKITR